jgi:hypothetical protein
MADMMALLRRPLCAEKLIARATQRTGFTDFGDTPFQPGLQAFLRACNEEAELSWFGYFGTRWDVVRFLSNLLWLRRAEVEMPEIREQPIERPIFITGLPRSGTTFLHKLLAEDHTNRVPLVWQLIHPYPAEPEGGRPDRRQQRVARQLRLFQKLAPEFRRLHPIDATSPQECTEITAHVFASLRFDMTHCIPSYRRWLDEVGHLDAYRFHKRFLQHLQHQAGGGGRWVLKCPDHVFALGAIRAVYPDARIVFVHRDPFRALLSVARLTEVLRRPFTRRFDRSGLGREQSERWLAATELMIATADRQPFAAPIYHMHHSDLVGNPLGAVAALYRHFDIGLATDTAARIARTVEANPDGGYATNRYRFEDYGFDAAVERERYARYMARFGITPEAGTDTDTKASAGQAAAPAPRLSAELAK